MRTQCVVFKMDSFDTESFNKRVEEAYGDSVIINFSFDKVWLAHLPGLQSRKQSRFRLLKIETGSEAIDYYLVVFCSFINLLFFDLILLLACLKFHPRVLLVEHTYVAIWGGFLRRIGLAGKSIYAAGDWVANDSNKKNLLGHWHCNIVFPRLDAWACRLNDEVLNYTPQIQEARFKFWSRKIPHSEKTYLYKPRVDVARDFIDKKEKKIFFLGNLRHDSGLDVVLSALKELNNRYGCGLTIVGTLGQGFDSFRRLACDQGVSELVEFKGFVETEELNILTEECFCSINLLTSQSSYSSYTVPGKFYHYLQHLLPVITTRGAGPFAQTVIQHGLGRVIDPQPQAFIDAAEDIFNHQKEYKLNILDYIDKIPKMDIHDLLGLKPGV